jgi:hypothetical protein
VVDKPDLAWHEFRAEPSDGLLSGDDPRLALLLELLIKLLECTNDTVFGCDLDEERAFLEGINSLRTDCEYDRAHEQNRPTIPLL